MYKYLLAWFFFCLAPLSFSATEEAEDPPGVQAAKVGLMERHLELTAAWEEDKAIIERIAPKLPAYDVAFLGDLFQRLYLVMPDTDNIVDPELCLQVFEAGAAWLAGPGKGTARGSPEDLLSTAGLSNDAWTAENYLEKLNAILEGTATTERSAVAETLFAEGEAEDTAGSGSEGASGSSGEEGGGETTDEDEPPALVED